MINQDAKQLIKVLNLHPHPEGGYYKRTYESDNLVMSSIHSQAEKRRAGTAIYYLLQQPDFSAWHRLKSDELWHFYAGDTVYIHVIDKDGMLTSKKLGDKLNEPDAEYQHIIRAGSWFAAELEKEDGFILLGCTVSPGFEFSDFELADRDQLIALYPQHNQIITKLTRK